MEGEGRRYGGRMMAVTQEQARSLTDHCENFFTRSYMTIVRMAELECDTTRWQKRRWSGDATQGVAKFRRRQGSSLVALAYLICTSPCGSPWSRLTPPSMSLLSALVRPLCRIECILDLPLARYLRIILGSTVCACQVPSHTGKAQLHRFARVFNFCCEINSCPLGLAGLTAATKLVEMGHKVRFSCRCCECALDRDTPPPPAVIASDSSSPPTTLFGSFSFDALLLCIPSQILISQVLVLEARDRVGGRTLGAPDGRRDLGAGYIGPTQNRIYALCKRFNLLTYKVQID